MTSGMTVLGLGHFAPERRITSQALEENFGLEPGWIKRRTGIDARRYADDSEALSDLVVQAGEMALAESGVDRRDVALVLLATSTPDHLLPPTAPLVAHRLGLSNAGAIDVAGACAGFIYALGFASGFARQQDGAVLILAGNILSRRINPADRNTSILFSDAAAAMLIKQNSDSSRGILGMHLASDGSAYDRIKIPAGGTRKPLATLTALDETLMVIDDGKAVFSRAVAMMTEAAQIALKRAGLTADDVTHFIPHQANARMMAAVAEQLGIAPRTIRSTIAEYGNSSAATIPFTLSHYAAQNAFVTGDVILMTAAGAGLTGGAIVMRW
jgi:3-oxoacyl-[acyl-carrier-protein] synthase III